MTKYRTTREVEARQWDGTFEGINDLCRWVNDAVVEATGVIDEPLLSYVTNSTGGVWDVFLETQTGALSIFPDCWIVKQGEGDYTARTAEQFEASYEVVEEGLEDGDTSTRFEYRVRGERSEGVNAGMEWGNHESDWKPHLPRRYDVEILARRRNRDVMVERRAVIVGEPTVVAFEDLAP